MFYVLRLESHYTISRFACCGCISIVIKNKKFVRYLLFRRTCDKRKCDRGCRTIHFSASVMLSVERFISANEDVFLISWNQANDLLYLSYTYCVVHFSVFLQISSSLQ